MKSDTFKISIKGFAFLTILQYLFLDAQIEGRITCNWIYVMIPTIIWVGALLGCSCYYAKKGYQLKHIYVGLTD